MGSAKETESTTAPASTSKTPDTDKDVEVSGSDAEESGYVVVRARSSSPTSRLVSFQDWRDGVDTWMAKSDAWRKKTDDKLKALTDVLLETRELVRSLSRVATTRPPHEFFTELDGRAQARAAREEAHASNSLDTEDPEEGEDLLAPEVPVKEEEIRAVLLQRSPITPSELVATFKARLKSPENKKAFTEILKRISKIHKTNNNQNYVVLRKDIKEKEIRPVLWQRSPLTTSEPVATFKARLKSFEDKKAFAKNLKRISKLQKINNNQNYVVLSKVSKSGKALKKLFGRSNGLNDSDGHDEDDGSSKRKMKDLKEEASDSSPAKSAAGKFSRGTPTSKLANGKRKNGDDTKPASGSALKKIKSESDGKPNTKDESSKTGGCSNITPSSAQGMADASSAQGPVKEEEIR